MVQSKRRRRCSSRTFGGLLFLIAVLLVLPWGAPARADSEPVPLQLDVKVNGYPLNLIAAFAQLPDGKIASLRSELAELGIAAPGDGPPDQLVSLDEIPGASYVYDETAQSIELEIPNGARIARELGASASGDTIELASGTGLVLNYAAFAAANYNINDALAGTSGGSLSLDARAYSNLGTIQQTAILGTTTFADMTALRLDTVWQYSDPRRLLTYRLGDIVSGGLNWTRPIRVGGGQLRRNFSLRPDLITRPLPLIQGTAAVPSTLDVYINGVKTYSSQVQEGPFNVDNLPVYTNSGTARVVLTDSTGRESESEGEFFTSPELLKHDLFDFSAEAGVVRRDYGSESFGYDDEPVFLGSARYGISDILNGEGHVEASTRLVEAGGGLVFNAGRFGILGGAVAGSLYDGEMGMLAYGSWSAQLGDFGISASAAHTFGDYRDLAAVTATSAGISTQVGVPRALDQISLTYNIEEFKAGVGLSFIHQLTADGRRSLIAGAGYSQSLPYDISMSANAYADLGDTPDYGVTLNFSMPLGDTMNSAVTATASRSEFTVTAEASKPFADVADPTAWRVAHSEGTRRATSANGLYRTSKAQVTGNLIQEGNMARGNVAVDGAVVVAGGGLMLGPTIYDSFAVVDAGAPGVTVEHENQAVGKTGGNGKLLLPNLHAFQRNKIGIDVDDLPLNASVEESEVLITPREMTGVVVNFGVKADEKAALVILTDAEGKVIPESSEVMLDGNPEPFLVGYDGQVYLTGIAARNSITVKHGGNQCAVSFAFDGGPEGQTTIGPLKCT